MCSNYMCGQYEDAFTPNRLRNWCCHVRTPPKCLSSTNLLRKSKLYDNLERSLHSKTAPSYLAGLCDMEPAKKIPSTDFIADDNGHLLRSKRNRSQVEENCCENNWLIDDESKRKRVQIPAWKVLPCFFKKHPKCKDDGMDEVAKLMKELKRRQSQLPIIWIFGLPQLSTNGVRRRYAQKLAKRLNFTLLDMDGQLSLWHAQHNPSAHPNSAAEEGNNVSQEFNNFKYLNIVHQRAHKMAMRLHLNSHETLNLNGLMEILKFALIQNYPTNGYIIMNFPNNIDEAEAFEKEFWPITTGIYFSTWTNEKSHSVAKRNYIEPMHFRRNEPYSESEVERCCDAFGFKTIKALNVEHFSSNEFQRLDELVDMFISAVPNILAGKKSGLLPENEETFLHNNTNHPVIVEGLFGHNVQENHGRRRSSRDKSPDNLAVPVQRDAKNHTSSNNSSASEEDE